MTNTYQNFLQNLGKNTASVLNTQKPENIVNDDSRAFEQIKSILNNFAPDSALLKQLSSLDNYPAIRASVRWSKLLSDSKSLIELLAFTAMGGISNISQWKAIPVNILELLKITESLSNQQFIDEVRSVYNAYMAQKKQTETKEESNSESK